MTTSAAGLLLLAGLLTGCGGGGSAPSDATEQEFCDSYAGLFSNLSGLDPEDTGGAIRAMKDWAADIEEVGTPEGIPDNAREGFEQMLESIDQIDEDATRQELEELGEELGEGSQEAGQAFASYAMTTCPDALGGLLDDLEDQMGELEDLTESPAG